MCVLDSWGVLFSPRLVKLTQDWILGLGLGDVNCCAGVHLKLPPISGGFQDSRARPRAKGLWRAFQALKRGLETILHVCLWFSG